MSNSPRELSVHRELYLPAPESIAAYAQNPCYTSAAGLGLVESVKHEALHFDAHGNKVYYHPRIYRRFSNDNGKTWTDTPDQTAERPDALAGRRRTVSLHTLDESRNALVSFFCTYDVDASQEMFSVGNLRKRTYRPWYELSFDAGRTWTTPKPVVDERPGFDETHWGPDLIFGFSGAQSDLSAPVWLGDGSLILGLTLTHAPLEGEDVRTPGRLGRMGVQYLRGRWNAAGTDFLWRFGTPVFLTAEQSPIDGTETRGCCEPAPATLGGERIFNVMRCQGNEKRKIPSMRHATLSNDGGETWTAPQALRYDDGQIVWSPASYSAFIRSSRTGEWFWIANILPGPVYAQMPRYPLCIAKLDPHRLCLIRDSVRVIQGRAPGLPEEVRYTNWGLYEERGTGDLILTLPEQPKLMNFTAMTRAEDFTADCHRYRVRL